MASCNSRLRKWGVFNLGVTSQKVLLQSCQDQLHITLRFWNVSWQEHSDTGSIDCPRNCSISTCDYHTVKRRMTMFDCDYSHSKYHVIKCTCRLMPYFTTRLAKRWIVTNFVQRMVLYVPLLDKTWHGGMVGQCTLHHNSIPSSIIHTYGAVVKPNWSTKRRHW